MKKLNILVICLAGLLLFSSTGWSQAPRPGQKTRADSTRKVVLQAKFGPFANGSPVLATDFQAIAGGVLKVVDSTTGTEWKVVKFRLGWRRRDVSDDIRTGKKKIVYLFNATEVYDSNRIPEAWQKEMKANIQPTEEVLFESIYVQHPVTMRMMECPPITLKIK